MAMESAECKTLWMGDVQMHWDEAFISSLFASARTFVCLLLPPPFPRRSLTCRPGPSRS